MQNKRATGLTLIEVLLAVTLLGIVSSIPFVLDSGVTNRLQAESAQSQLGHAFRKAQFFSQSGKNDQTWGVHIQSNGIIVFAGQTFATRNSGYDEALYFDAKKITLTVTSGQSDIIFSKTTGTPSGSNVTSIRSVTGDTKSISLSSEGKLTYNN